MVKILTIFNREPVDNICLYLVAKLTSLYSVRSELFKWNVAVEINLSMLTSVHFLLQVQSDVSFSLLVGK